MASARDRCELPGRNRWRPRGVQSLGIIVPSIAHTDGCGVRSRLHSFVSSGWVVLMEVASGDYGPPSAEHAQISVPVLSCSGDHRTHTRRTAAWGSIRLRCRTEELRQRGVGRLGKPEASAGPGLPARGRHLLPGRRWHRQDALAKAMAEALTALSTCPVHRTCCLPIFLGLACSTTAGGFGYPRPLFSQVVPCGRIRATRGHVGGTPERWAKTGLAGRPDTPARAAVLRHRHAEPAVQFRHVSARASSASSCYADMGIGPRRARPAGNTATA